MNFEKKFWKNILNKENPDSEDSSSPVEELGQQQQQGQGEGGLCHVFATQTLHGRECELELATLLDFRSGAFLLRIWALPLGRHFGSEPNAADEGQKEGKEGQKGRQNKVLALPLWTMGPLRKFVAKLLAKERKGKRKISATAKPPRAIAPPPQIVCRNGIILLTFFLQKYKFIDDTYKLKLYN